MAESGKDEGGARRTATSLSRSLAIAIVMTGSAARAQEATPAPPDLPAVAQPPPPDVSTVTQQFPPADPPQPAPPAYPPPVVRPPRPPRPPGPSGFERRHHVGGQIGGTGLIQAVYRFRATGPLHLEIGALGADHGANLSAGVVIGSPVGNRWFPYVGMGGGFMVAGGPAAATECSPPTTCPPEKTGEDFEFVHARVGIGVAFGGTRRNLISIDVGGWYGRHREDWNDIANGPYKTSKMTVLPMAGLSYFFAVH